MGFNERGGGALVPEICGMNYFGGISETITNLTATRGLELPGAKLVNLIGLHSLF